MLAMIRAPTQQQAPHAERYGSNKRSTREAGGTTPHANDGSRPSHRSRMSSQKAGGSQDGPNKVDPNKSNH